MDDTVARLNQLATMLGLDVEVVLSKDETTFGIFGRVIGQEKHTKLLHCSALTSAVEAFLMQRATSAARQRAKHPQYIVLRMADWEGIQDAYQPEVPALIGARILAQQLSDSAENDSDSFVVRRITPHGLSSVVLGSYSRNGDSDFLEAQAEHLRRHPEDVPPAVPVDPVAWEERT